MVPALNCIHGSIAHYCSTCLHDRIAELERELKAYKQAINEANKELSSRTYWRDVHEWINNRVAELLAQKG